MNYATTARRPNPLAAVGALGVPATFGAVLVIGLAVTATVRTAEPRTEGFFVPVKPEVEPLPPPEITPETQTSSTTVSPIDRSTLQPIPSPDVNLLGDEPLTIGSGFNEGWGSGLEPLDIDPPAPRPTPLFDPVGATPRGNPSNWITTADYRSTWIRRELTGTARFTLQINASGKVSGCKITASTGHTVLDRATCTLLRERAIFNPAKGSDGKAVAGTYASSVNWSIPD
ncbi:MAG: TonB family protein [Pseudomonadota bacterium]